MTASACSTAGADVIHLLRSPVKRLALYYAILGLYEARSGEGVIKKDGEVRDIAFITRKLIANLMPLKVSDSARSNVT
jgi:hypothetical protein